MCTKWFLGTGGGDGCTSMFENWDEAKYEKYGVDMDTYDHHDVSKRPTVLINLYHKHRYPYLTMIHLWDEVKSFLLSSKYDPLHSEKGEAGLPRCDSSLSVLTNSSSSRRVKRSPKGKEDSGSIRDTMREMISLLAKNTAATVPVKPPRKIPDYDSNSSSVNWSIIYDKHINHMKFLKENDLFTGKRKADVMDNIDKAYVEMTQQAFSNVHRDNNNELDNNSINDVS